jgi:hypothetical protein
VRRSASVALIPGVLRAVRTRHDAAQARGIAGEQIVATEFEQRLAGTGKRHPGPQLP